jgi:hypothetical protein
MSQNYDEQIDVGPTADAHLGRVAAFCEPDASYVRFYCTVEELSEAQATSRPDVPLTDPLRSVVHEHTHLQHAHGTPAGMFLRRIQQVQSTCVLIMLRLLVEHKLPLRLPLIRWITGQRPSIKRATQVVRQTWYAAELLRTMQLGTHRAWEHVALNDEFAGQIDVASAIKNLSALLQWMDECMQSGKGQPPSFSGKPHSETDAYAYESAKDLSMTQALWATLSDDFNLAAVLESTAYVSEFYGATPAEFATAQTVGNRVSDSTYKFLLVPEPATGLRNAEPLVQILTRRAAAELCLFGPILHELAGLRATFRTQDYLPLARWLRLWALSDLKPVADLSDVPRYYDDVCERMGWVHPRDVCAAAHLFQDRQDTDLRSLAFAMSLAARRVDSGVFVNPTAALFIRNPLEKMVGEQFDFATIECAGGRTLLHKDRNRVFWFKLDYLWDRWLRHIMLSPNPVLELVWRSDAEERSFLADKLREQLAYMLETDAPLPRLQGPELPA